MVAVFFVAGIFYLDSVGKNLFRSKKAEEKPIFIPPPPPPEIPLGLRGKVDLSSIATSSFQSYPAKFEGTGKLNKNEIKALEDFIKSQPPLKNDQSTTTKK